MIEAEGRGINGDSSPVSGDNHITTIHASRLLDWKRSTTPVTPSSSRSRLLHHHHHSMQPGILVFFLSIDGVHGIDSISHPFLFLHAPLQHDTMTQIDAEIS